MNSLTLIRLDLQAKQPGEGFPVLTIANWPARGSVRRNQEENQEAAQPYLGATASPAWDGNAVRGRGVSVSVVVVRVKRCREQPIQSGN